MTYIQKLLTKRRADPVLRHAEMVVDFGLKLTAECEAAHIQEHHLVRHLGLDKGQVKEMLFDPESVGPEVIESLLKYIEKRKKAGSQRKGPAVEIDRKFDPKITAMRRMWSDTQAEAPVPAGRLGMARAEKISKGRA